MLPGSLTAPVMAEQIVQCRLRRAAFERATRKALNGTGSYLSQSLMGHHRPPGTVSFSCQQPAFVELPLDELVLRAQCDREGGDPVLVLHHRPGPSKRVPAQC